MIDRTLQADREGAERTSSSRDLFKRVRTADICRFARQLATLLRAGMPLVPALSALVEQSQDDPEHKPVFGSKNNYLGQIVRQVRDQVNAGSSLADALGEHPDVFSPLFVNMVAAGETGGTLEEVLLRLAQMLEKRRRLTGKVTSAIAYPLTMAVVAAGVVVFLMSYVVPSIAQIFLEMDQVLPWPTRFLISISTFTEAYLTLIIGVFCVACLAIVAGYRTEQGRFLADRCKLRLPLFGGLLLKLEIARLTQTLGMLLASGIPILQALTATKAVIRNKFMAATFDSVETSVAKGDSLAGAMKQTGLFPPVVFHIVQTGQISGSVEEDLTNIAEMYEDEVEITTRTLTSLLEPAILLVMGTVVGFLVLAILLPIFEINQAL
jgi:type II secretory pathway component PulF